MRNEWCDLGAESLLRCILQEAAAKGASDVHIEPQDSDVRIRFRLDGVLHEEGRLAKAMAPSLSVRAKVLSHMDVGESRRPQDGSFSVRKNGTWTDFRVSVLPSLYGETIVIRILSGKQPFIEKEELGMLPVQERLFRETLRKGSGLILTTGPTGSGKTSTLYAALHMLNDPSVSIVSVEDPVEYRLTGVTQIGVNEKAGLTFARGLRSILRQDPDIILIGEIRDEETADIAIHAALTGHLVLSTLHTENASLAPMRLQDMGIPAYLIAASLSLVISQKLVRKTCPYCGGKSSAAEAAEKGTPLSGTETSAVCPRCHGTGTLGRTGVFELLPITKEARRLIHEEAGAEALQDIMKKEGQPDFRRAAEMLLQDGRISMEAYGSFCQGGRE